MEEISGVVGLDLNERFFLSDAMEKMQSRIAPENERSWRDFARRVFFET